MFTLLFLFLFLASSLSSSQDQDTEDIWVSHSTEELCFGSSYSPSHWSFGPARTTVLYTSVHLCWTSSFYAAVYARTATGSWSFQFCPDEFQTWLQYTSMGSHKPDNRLGPLGMDCEFWAMMRQPFGCRHVRASGEVTHIEMCRHLSTCGREWTAPSESEIPCWCWLVTTVLWQTSQLEQLRCVLHTRWRRFSLLGVSV